MRKCYNCGIPLKELPKEERTKEHIPARALFDGFPEEYKTNRLTVPACKTCNEDFSKIDQEIRNMIAIWTDGAISRENLRKAAKSILTQKNWRDRTHVDVNGKVRAVEFPYDDLRQIHIKNFKGVFYKHNGYPLPDSYRIEIVADGDTVESVLRAGDGLYQVLDSNMPWHHSGHPEVFRYNLGCIHTNGNAIEINDKPEGAFTIVSAFEYHELVVSVVIATPADFF